MLYHQLDLMFYACFKILIGWLIALEACLGTLQPSLNAPGHFFGLLF